MISAASRRAGFSPRAGMHLLLAATSLLALGLTMPAQAQTTPLQLAQAGTRSFSIPAQSLAGALTSFGQQSGLQITVDSALVSGLQSPGVSGNLTAEDALRRLLSGTGLVWRIADGRTVTLERGASGSGAVSLDPLLVQGQRPVETATGPVDGYIASRSATGTKTDARLMETPQSVSVITRDQMDMQGAQSVNSALRYSAGVITDQRPATRYDIAPLRGFGGFQSFVQYQDGLRLQRGLSQGVPAVEAHDLERVELLRGPGSVLYGQGSPGGLINLVSKKPMGNSFNEIELQTGSYDRFQGAFDLGGALDANKTMLYRFNGLARSADTQIDYVQEERLSLSPSLTWRPNADTNLTVMFNYLSDPESLYSVFLPASGTIVPNAAGQIRRSFNVGNPYYDMYERSQTSFGYQFEHSFNDTWAVRQNFRFMHLSSEFRSMTPGAITGTTISRTRSRVADNFESYALDNHAQANFDTGVLRHTALVGLDVQYQDADRSSVSNVASPSINYLNPVYTPVSIPNYTEQQHALRRQTGLYLQDQVKLENLTVLASARHDWSEIDSTTTTIATNAKTNVQQGDRAWTGRFGAIYEFPVGIAPYASYSTSFEPNSGTAFGGQAFEPTEGEQYEVGVKYQPPGKESFVQVSGYDLTQTNVLTRDPVNNGFNVQTGEVQSKGLEFEGKFVLTPSWNLIAAYTISKTEITKSNATNGEQGHRPLATPDHVASAWSDYTFREGDLKGFGFGGGVRYIGDQMANATNTMSVDDYTLVDAALFYDIGALSPKYQGLRFSLNVSNLFDKEYIAACSAASNNLPGCYYGLARTVYATMKYRW